MNLNFNTNNIKRASKSRPLWIALLFCWLLIANIATVHQQKHSLLNDFECQYCVSSFSNTPVISADLISLTEQQPNTFTPIEILDSLIISQAIELNSRGPPQTLV